MNKDQLENLRKWVLAEIEYALAATKEDSEGYRGDAGREWREAERLFDVLVASQESWGSER